MTYIYHYHSPLGGITLSSNGTELTGLWFDGQKYFGSTLTEEYEERDLPVTSKEKTEGHGYGQTHGYGLSNIRMVARKYSGDIAIDLKEDEFRLSIMLMME